MSHKTKDIRYCEIKSCLNNVKTPANFTCSCGFEGWFTPEKCPKCGIIIKSDNGTRSKDN